MAGGILQAATEAAMEFGLEEDEEDPSAHLPRRHNKGRSSLVHGRATVCAPLGMPSEAVSLAKEMFCPTFFLTPS